MCLKKNELKNGKDKNCIIIHRFSRSKPLADQKEKSYSVFNIMFY